MAGVLALALLCARATPPASGAEHGGAGARRVAARDHAASGSLPAAADPSGVAAAHGSQASPSALPSAVSGTESIYTALAPIRFSDDHTRDSLTLRLYGVDGRVDETSAKRLDQLLCDARDPQDVKVTHIDRRLLQLLFRTAYHFGAERVEIVSAYRAPRKRREGLHSDGRAIDFKLPHVRATALAAYLRTLPKVGVGVYTHRRTQFAHLDVREHSFYWIDASPPGKRWREQSLGRRGIDRRDTHYSPSDDWPEGVPPPAELASASLLPAPASSISP